MDAARYARVRELFLAAEELPAEQQDAFLRIQAGSDTALLSEVKSLLSEHDPESARIEGDRATPPAPPYALASKPRPQSTAPAKQNAGTTKSGDQDNSSTRTRDGRPRGSEITQHGAERTHASPRYGDTPAPESAPTLPLWARRSRESRRTNSRWLWLAALLPTALIGWWALDSVQDSVEVSVRNELQGHANSVTQATERFLSDKSELVRSWSAQPAISRAIAELVEFSDQESQGDPSKRDTATQAIHEILRELSQRDEVQFTIWNTSYITIADSDQDHAELGRPVPPSGAADLNRVMRGETVIVGPRRHDDRSEGRSDIDNHASSDQAPELAIMVPVTGQHGQTIAALSVEGLDLFKQFDQIFAEVFDGSGIDAYATDARGTMLSQSRRAAALADSGALDVASEQIAAMLRLADPGRVLTPDSVTDFDRAVSPLTISVADVTNGHSRWQLDPYANYAGIPVVGAWRWIPATKIGVVIERDAQTAFAPVRIVRFSFLLLGSVLSLTAFGAAAKIASRSARENAAVHPLSRYELIEEIGSGGMGVVYRARHRQLGRETALKVLRGDRGSKEDRLRFDREARLAATLSSPHSVLIYDYGRSQEGEAYCVMEYLHGLTLNQVVARGGYQPIGRVLFIISQICEALNEAHDLNLLHRDIKPQNVMLSLDAAVGDWAVVFDYGLAKPLESNTSLYQTSETVWAGTPMYMAPERFREPAVMDPRSDIYSVGCVAYYLLAGRPPFIECEPESLFALILTQQPISIALHRDGQIPEAISQLVLRCMAKDKHDRFESVAQLASEIEQLRTEHPWSLQEAKDWWQRYGNDD